MTDFALLHKQARHDIRMCLQAWIEILRDELGERIDYVYTKGSSIKNWDSAIDYVPVLSDVDIHIILKDDDDLFSGNDERFEAAMRFSKRFEDRFYELDPDPLHFPRSQLIHINEFQKKKWFVIPKPKHVRPLIGKPKPAKLPSENTIREIDLQNLLELQEYLHEIPMSAVDRAGFDFWSMIRRMLWRVSPTPVRLITQTHDEPSDVWNWNRTAICVQLRKIGLDDIERFYRGFYLAGWNLFISGFTNRDDYRDVVLNGYRLLKGCHDQALKF